MLNYIYLKITKMINMQNRLSLLKLYISSFIQPFDIKSLFLLDFDLLGIDKFGKICFNFINHQGG